MVLPIIKDLLRVVRRQSKATVKNAIAQTAAGHLHLVVVKVVIVVILVVVGVAVVVVVVKTPAKI